MAFIRDKTLQKKLSADKRSQGDRETARRASAAARLKTFDWGEPDLGIRRQDVEVFLAAARGFDHFILARATNPRSLEHIGPGGNAVPKPIDCKPKTANKNCYINTTNTLSNTAGLVVDPELVGPGAFGDDKYEKARKAWSEFLADKSPQEIASKVFRRRGKEGGSFVVDTVPGSAYYGCLMVTRHPIDTSFKLPVGAPLGIGGRYKHFSFIHGDYDLYAVIKCDDPNAKPMSNELHGVTNYFSPTLPGIQDFVNRGIGVRMIQHGDQYRYKHYGDLVYVFYPDHTAYRFLESADSIQEIFSELFKVSDPG